MTEWKLFDGDVPYVSTAEFHADRERAPHLEQEWHQPRLYRAVNLVRDSITSMQAEDPLHPITVSDLGCGDGGLLQALAYPLSWGYDFAPANAAGWTERRVTAVSADVFGADQDRIRLGDIVVMTEVLEHVADPHGVLRWLKGSGVPVIVCSSPLNENQHNHSPEHAWAWDTQGYAEMLAAAGWVIANHEQAGLFQVVRAVNIT